MIYGTGIDVVDITRFERFIEEGKTALLERLFCPSELEYCSKKKRGAQHFALRFAAKEALLKALGTGLTGGLSWHQIEVMHDARGKPELRLSGKALELFTQAGLGGCHVALSHDANVAVASVVLESK